MYFAYPHKIPINPFTPGLVSTLLHTGELSIKTQQKYLINLRLQHLSIPYRIMFQALLTPMPWSFHALLSHIYIDNLESSLFGSYVLISFVFRAIITVSSFHILSIIIFIIGYRIVWVVSWPNPLSDLYLRSASKITSMVIHGGYEYRYLHS